jgi:hypothetical protein
MKAIHLTAYGNPAQNLKMVNVRPTVFLENPFFYGFAAESIRRTGELQLPFAARKIFTDCGARCSAQSPRNIRRDSDGR